MIKEIKYSPNYDKIVNFLYEDNDEISKKIIESYQEYIFNIKNKKCKENIDSVLNNYTDKGDFYKYVQDYFNSHDLYETYNNIIIILNKLYKEYEEAKLKTIKNVRWL